MPWLDKHTVEVVTDGAGSGVGYTTALRGYVHSIRYVKTDYVDGVAFAVSCDLLGTAIWTEANVNASKHVLPRQPAHNIDGTQAGTGPSTDAGGVAVVDERVKIAVSNGGANKTGTFHVLMAT